MYLTFVCATDSDNNITVIGTDNLIEKSMMKKLF